MVNRKSPFWILLGACLVFGCAKNEAPPDPDLLPTIGAAATTGAVAGYVDDQVCGTCHSDTYATYQDVGMAQSLRKPGHQTPMEDFGVEYHDEKLQRFYQIVEDGDDLVFRRYQHDKNGDEINLLEIPVAWVLGSGNRARSYLYQTDWGEIFMLPIGWYSEDRVWGMSPGFEFADHPGITRAIQRKCLFCHNAFPAVPEGSDAPWVAETFPHDLPEGTGCQRCHGPGADHIQSALQGNELEETRGRIVNPAKLSAELRDSVCFQCHMLPSASLTGAHRVGRGVYSFRPGEKLSDYLVHVDPVERGEVPEERFEINHHAYRFTQSSCYLESAGQFSCIDCHDPHVKPESATFRTGVEEVCTGCHASARDLHSPTTDTSGEQCVTCHMPRRRTGDVVHVTMTDHRIAKGPFDLNALVAPISKQNRAITHVELLDLFDTPEDEEADVYRSLAALRSGRNINTAHLKLEEALKDIVLFDNEPYVDLATSQFTQGRYPAAEATARKLIADGEHLRPAYAVLGTSLLAQGDADGAIGALSQSLAVREHPEVHFNLAAAYLGTGEYALAEEHIDAAIRLRPYMANAWKYKGRLLRAKNADREARDAFVRTLQLQPLDLAIYGELIDLFRSLGQADEAERYLELGLRMSEMISELQ